MSVTKLDACESAMLMVQMARDNLRGQIDLRCQLADIRLRAALEALSGTIDVQAYEAKLLGNAAPAPSQAAERDVMRGKHEQA